MKVVLIRHGKTPGNEAGIYIGRKLDEYLSETGIEEIRRCRLYDELISDEMYFFTSPMERAKQTCKLLFGKEGFVIDELSEIDFGDFEGKNYQQLNGNPEYQRWIDSGGRNSFAGCESRDEFVRRNLFGFERVLGQLSMDGKAESSEIKTAVVVCHGGTIMAILSSITGEDYFDFQVKNLEGYEIEFKKENERIIDISYNRIAFGNPS